MRLKSNIHNLRAIMCTARTRFLGGKPSDLFFKYLNHVHVSVSPNFYDNATHKPTETQIYCV